MAGLLSLSLLLFSIAGALGARDHSYEPVTCGSLLTLVHSPTTYNLHSHPIAWGSGSGQQSVTTSNSANDQDNLWLVREASGTEACRVGEPVPCGGTVRLQHMATGKNLHSHGYRAPLSGNQEVTGFGDENGEGDDGDDWRVLCGSNKSGFWRRSKDVRLKHDVTGRYLTSSTSAAFNDQNCRNCPIVGQMEVSAATSGSSASSPNHMWYADQGVFFPPPEDAVADANDEL